MASQSEGIQRLLEAEKEAQKDVDAARRRKLIFCNFCKKHMRKISRVTYYIIYV